jgi:hypothetical protein
VGIYLQPILKMIFFFNLQRIPLLLVQCCYHFFISLFIAEENIEYACTKLISMYKFGFQPFDYKRQRWSNEQHVDHLATKDIKSGSFLGQNSLKVNALIWIHLEYQMRSLHALSTIQINNWRAQKLQSLNIMINAN